jgi:threonine dehydrogenase-like Zn-dependent dehydrogenase
VLVAVKECAICGSDLHFAAHGAEMLAASAQLEDMPSTGAGVDLGADVFMGHEFSAEVVDAGPDTEAPPPGTLVTSIPVLWRRPVRR